MTTREIPIEVFEAKTKLVDLIYRPRKKEFWRKTSELVLFNGFDFPEWLRQFTDPIVFARVVVYDLSNPGMQMAVCYERIGQDGSKEKTNINQCEDHCGIGGFIDGCPSCELFKTGKLP